MAKQKTKRSGNSRPQGRQNAFSGVKLEFLESYKDRFLASMDRGAFYTLVAKSFIEHFGYNLAIEENPGICDEDAPGENDPELQSPEELEQDVERQNSFYRELREKLGCWYRYRYTSKNTNQSYINNIIDRITSTSVSRPRKKTAINLYSEVNSEQLNEDFGRFWLSVKDSMRPQDRIRLWGEFVRKRWKDDTPKVREEISKQVETENEKAMNVWKKNLATFTGTPEELDQAWKTAEDVLPSFADAMSEWLGANIVILAVTPLGSSGGEIVMRSVQSDSSKGMTKKLLPEFDPDGWKRVQEVMLAYGKAYFTPEECRRRIVKEPSDRDETVDDMDDPPSICVDPRPMLSEPAAVHSPLPVPDPAAKHTQQPLAGMHSFLPSTTDQPASMHLPLPSAPVMQPIVTNHFAAQLPPQGPGILGIQHNDINALADANRWVGSYWNSFDGLNQASVGDAAESEIAIPNDAWFEDVARRLPMLQMELGSRFIESDPAVPSCSTVTNDAHISQTTASGAIPGNPDPTTVPTAVAGVAITVPNPTLAIASSLTTGSLIPQAAASGIIPSNPTPTTAIPVPYLAVSTLNTMSNMPMHPSNLQPMVTSEPVQSSSNLQCNGKENIATSAKLDEAGDRPVLNSTRKVSGRKRKSNSDIPGVEGTKEGSSKKARTKPGEPTTANVTGKTMVRKSGRSSTLPGHLKAAGYARPKKGLRAKGD